VVRVYAKARNNDPTVPYNSRGLSFKSGRGFAVDVRVRDYNGSAAARYAEGVIVGFYESEAEACRVANEINNGTRYPPGHHFHTRAHGAIVVPAWNGPDVPDTLPWETPEGSAEMVAAYRSAGVPIPRWLTRILKRLGSHSEQTDLDGTAEAATTRARSNREAVRVESEKPLVVDRSAPIDGDLLRLIRESVMVGDVIRTLGTAQPNRIVSIEASGIRVATRRSDLRGTGPQLIPGWMITTAWDYLRQNGSLTQRQLLDDLNVKRSAFVCALLARLPQVDHVAVPQVTLTFRGWTRSSKYVQPAPFNEDEAESQVLPGTYTDPPVNRVAAWSGATEYAARLNRLFELAISDLGEQLTEEDVATALQADGIPVHANSIARLRQGAGPPPRRRTSEALAFFFNADPDYLLEGIDFTEFPNAKVSPAIAGTEMPPRRRRFSTALGDGGRVTGQRPVPPATDIRLSTTDLLRISAGLNAAAQTAAQRAYADRGLVRRLSMLISDAAGHLVESLESDARVPVRFLEQALLAWDETDPGDTGTESDYRWLAELLNRHLG